MRNNTDHIESASTATSAFFRYPAKSTNAIKYHVSKLHQVFNKHIYDNTSNILYDIYY